MSESFRSFADILTSTPGGMRGAAGVSSAAAAEPGTGAAGPAVTPQPGASGSAPPNGGDAQRAAGAPQGTPARHGATVGAVHGAPPEPARGGAASRAAASGATAANAAASGSATAVADPSPGAREEPPTPPPIMLRDVDAPPVRGASPHIAAVLSTFAAEIVRLRARAAELVENEAESILQMIASRVLVRELELAPADVRALVEGVRREWDAQHGMRFRVAAADVERLRGLGATLESDPALQPGDLQVEFADGVLDLRLGTRLAAVLDERRIAV